ncbi:hypothetical protein BDQ17DRAFT_1423963 [Cyathus striatus]|nr:hypothetical protein BDQ17DRAFT_1423963 [Cyathus striatus]
MSRPNRAHQTFNFGSQRGGRGRGARGRGSWIVPNFPITSPVEDDRDIMEGLEESPIVTLARPNEQAMADVSITRLEYVGSYNWTTCDQPTMIVPGSPPMWLNRPTPYAVDPDIGVQFGTIRRRQIINWPEVDFVTDRNQLRMLLRWVADEDTEFRIDMQLAGAKTILLSRWEKRTRERFPGLTYALNFVQASTSPVSDCPDSTGHHRILTYNLCGLKMVVRFAVDAYLSDAKQKAAVSSMSSDVDSLVGLLATTKISSKGPTRDVKKPEASTITLKDSLSAIKVIHGGSYIPQSSIAETSTRSVNRQHLFEWKDRYPHLFLSQTSHHFLAVHMKGTFTEIRHTTLGSSELKEADKELQSNFKKLVLALQAIQKLVVKHGKRGRLSLVYQSGELKVFERTTLDGCLPDDVINIFE